MSDHTPTPWELVPSTEHHGPYVTGPYGGDICDCYAMSNYLAASVRNGGTSFPIHHQGEAADANAAFIVRAVNAHDDLVAALRQSNELLGKLMPLLLGQDDRWVEKMGTALGAAHTALAKAEAQS